MRNRGSQLNDDSRGEFYWMEYLFKYQLPYLNTNHDEYMLTTSGLFCGTCHNRYISKISWSGFDTTVQLLRNTFQQEWWSMFVYTVFLSKDFQFLKFDDILVTLCFKPQGDANTCKLNTCTWYYNQPGPYYLFQTLTFPTSGVHHSPIL